MNDLLICPLITLTSLIVSLKDALGILTLIFWKGIFNENLINVSRIPIGSLLSLASIRSFFKSCFCVCDLIHSIMFNLFISKLIFLDEL